MRVEAGGDRELRPKNFWDNYCLEISPRLTEIDVLLKTTEPPYDIEYIADLLDITVNEIKSILGQTDIRDIDKKDFFSILENGSGKLCGFYRREVDCGSPNIYSADKISYIYQIKINDVKKALDSLGIKEVTTLTIPLLFANIPA